MLAARPLGRPVLRVALRVHEVDPLDLTGHQIGADRARAVRAGVVELPAAAREQTVPALDQVRDTIPLPEGYYFRFGGSLEDMAELMTTMLFTIGLIVLLVYMVMASQFESFVQPLSIMCAVPMSIIGVVLALLITRTTLSVMSFIGIMILIGVLVNNGIVLIDYINQLRAHGMEKNEAIIQGGITRVRPILMTTLTTILALLPMALNRGEGAELFSPISITIFGGLLVSTLITLLIVPSIYSMIDDAVVWIQGKSKR